MSKTKSVKIQTPIGSIESDSGSHLIDLITILSVIVIFIVIKKIIKEI
tara:strand:- start:1114 stop:1257 length:144 start_codon:yes stop_codon:yes gene_type:complete